MPKQLGVKKNPIYIVFYKPHGVLSQFTDPDGRRNLSDFGPFPKGIYPVGRLDADSEGLLLLTDDNEAKRLLLEPRFGHSRTYLVQVETVPSEEALEKLRSGVVLEGRKTMEAVVHRLAQEPTLPPREVPVRYRKNVSTSWLEITLKEGRNRQVRRMTAAVGHPTLRLLRIAQGPLTLSHLKPGGHRPLSESEVRHLLDSLRITGPGKKDV